MSGILVLVLALALVFWLGFVIKAKITRQEVPWKGEPRPRGTPMALAYRGAGAELPKLEPEQRKRSLRFAVALFGAYGVVTGGSGLVAWALSGNGDITIVVMIFTFVVVWLVSLPLASQFDKRSQSKQ